MATAKELGYEGMHVNLVSPRGSDTPMMDAVTTNHSGAADI